MPAMGDSVSEGTVLEWHKQEGDQVSEDEVLVEISTDKVDAEVPAPTTGTVVEDPRRRGRHDHGRRRARRDLRRATTALRRFAEPESCGEKLSRSSCRRWASRCPRARSSNGPKQPGDEVAEDETIVEISTDKVDAEVPAPASGTIEEILAQAGDTVTVGQVIARMTTSNGATRQGSRAHRRAAPAGERAAADPGRAEGDPGGRSRGRCARRRSRERQGLGAGRPDLEGRRARRRERRASRRGGQAAQGRQRDARALHGRVALDPDRDLVPHAHRHHPRRPPQAAQGGRPAGLLHAPDRLRRRPRRDRADAGHGALVPGDRRQAARARRRRRQPRHRRRRRAQGRRAHADGPRDPRRRPPLVLRVPRRVQRPDHASA